MPRPVPNVWDEISAGCCKTTNFEPQLSFTSSHQAASAFSVNSIPYYLESVIILMPCPCAKTSTPHLETLIIPMPCPRAKASRPYPERRDHSNALPMCESLKAIPRTP